MKKVLSYSLWCQEESVDRHSKVQCKEMYCNGAIQNLEIRKQLGIYKDWTFRFYIDNTVPKDVIEKLKGFGLGSSEAEKMGGVEIIDMTGSKIPGMFWRFLAINDEVNSDITENNSDLFIVRDCDSRISLREEKIVNEWIKSPKLMHIIRDHPHHHYKILGGMWGLKLNNNRISHNIRYLFNNYLEIFLSRRNFKFTRMDDMKFLDLIYDKIDNKNIMEHDNFFGKKFGNSIQLLDGFSGEYYPYIGETVDAFNNKPYINRDVVLFKNYRIE